MGHAVDVEAVKQLEERLINVWPAINTLMMDGWAVRFANGYSARANSASALVRGAVLSDRTRVAIEDLYARAGVARQIRLTPVADASVEAALLANGYHVKNEAQCMVAALSSSEHHHGSPDVAFSTQSSKGCAARKHPKNNRVPIFRQSSGASWFRPPSPPCIKMDAPQLSASARLTGEWQRSAA
jgi:Tfp pilus tip-associated adhesin PilY1